jgi:2-dehydro-3-deoxyphosphooctonate aldolase (KDO 8-P synthase)
MMAEAAKAFGATGFFLEVHPDPDRGLSDAANMLEVDKLEGLLARLVAHSLVKSEE